MRLKTLGILSGISAAAIAAAVVLVVFDTPGASSSNDDILWPELAERVNTISRVIINGPGGVATVERDTDGTWVLVEKSGYPVKPDMVKRAVVGLANLRSVEPMTSNPAKYSRLNVEDRGPDTGSTQITLSSTGGDVSILLGSYVVEADAAPHGRAEMYVRRVGEAQSWHARGDLAVPETPMDWLDLKVVDLPRSEIKSVVITHPDGSVVRVGLPHEGADDFIIENVPTGFEPKTEFVANSVGSSLGWLTVEDVAPLDDPPVDATTSIYTTWDGRNVIIHTFQRDGRWWFTAEKPGADDEALVKKWAYGISSYKAKDFAKTMADLTKPIEEQPSNDR